MSGCRLWDKARQRGDLVTAARSPSPRENVRRGGKEKGAILAQVMKRRTLLKAAATLGALGAAGTYGRFRWLSPHRSRKLGSVDDLARRFVDSLSPETRRKVCVDYDHPLRQYHNRGVRGGGLEIDADSFTWEQRRMLTDLFYAGLSEQGRERLPNEFFIQYR